MWRKTILVALLLALMALETSATELRYEFSNESCDASVTYDPARHDPEAVKNTADILYGFFDYHGLSCHARAELLRSTRFVDLASVKALTASIADGSETYCELLAVEERGAKDTHALREYPDSEACYPIVDALEGKTDLIRYWRAMIAEQATHNGDPERFLARQHALESLPDFHDRIRQDVLKFGWHNCVVEILRAQREAEARYRAQAEEEFASEFHLETKNCNNSAD